MKKNPNTVARVIADETILVPIGKKASQYQSIFRLKGVAARIWQLLDHLETEEEIKSKIVSEYQVTEDVAEQDVKHFIHQLRIIGALEEV